MNGLRARLMGLACVLCGCVDVPVPGAPTAVDGGADGRSDGRADATGDVGPSDDRGPPDALALRDEGFDSTADGQVADGGTPACEPLLAAYAPVAGFDAVHVLADGTVLVGGLAEGFEAVRLWGGERVALDLPLPVPPQAGAQGVPFVMELSPDLQTIRRVLHLPRNSLGTVRAIRGRGRDAPDAPLTLEVAFAGNATGSVLLTLGADADGVPEVVGASSIPTLIDQPGAWAVADDGSVAALGIVQEQQAPAAIQGLKWHLGGALRVLPAARFHLDDEDKFVDGPQPDEDTAFSFLPLTAGYRCFGRTRTDAANGAGAIAQLGEDAVGSQRRVGAEPFDAFSLEACPAGGGALPQRVAGPLGWGVVPQQHFGSVFVARSTEDGATYVLFRVTLDNPGDDGAVDQSPVLMRIDADGAMGWWRRLHPDLDDNGERIAAADDQYPTGLVATPDGGVLVTLETGFDAPAAPWDAVDGFDRFQGRPGGAAFARTRAGWIGRVSASGRLERVTWLYTTADAEPAAFRPPPLDDFVDTGRSARPAEPVTLVRSALARGADGRVAVAFETLRNAGVTVDGWLDPQTPDAPTERARFVRIYDPDLSTVQYASGLGDGAGGPLDLTPSGLAFDAQGQLLVVGRQQPGDGRVVTGAVPEWGEADWDGMGGSRAFILRLSRPLDCP